jgi:hypothetical protein
MRNYINLFESTDLAETYTEPNTYLKRYLAGGEFDYYAFWYYAGMWVKRSLGEEEFEEQVGEPYDEEDPEQFEKMDKQSQEDFTEWCLNYLAQHDPGELPSTSYFTPDDKLLPRTTWLVHFTDHAREVANNGFTHGTAEADRLGLTTYTKHDHKQGGGYNFAFIAGTRDAYAAASRGKYGKHCVVFQNSGIKAWHSGDEEHQVIFWGPDVDKRFIALILNDGGDFVVTSRTGMSLFRGEFEDAVKWTMAHHRQYSKQLYA